MSLPVSAIIGVVALVFEAMRQGGERRFASAVIVWATVPFVLLASLPSAASGHPAALLVASISIVLLFPYPIARSLLIPIGAWRAAWLVGRVAFFTWRGDAAGGALVTALYAARNASASSRERARTFVARRCSKLRRVAGGSILAEGLLAAARGDLGGARRLIESVELLDPRSFAPMTRRHALEWRAAEAAARGNWHEVVALADEKLANRRTRLLGQVARRLLGREDSPDSTVFRRARRSHTATLHPLIDRALASPPRRPRGDLVDVEADPRARALEMHVMALRRGAELELEDLRRLGRAWDVWLSDQTLAEEVLARARELGCRAPGDVLAGLRADVEQDLRAMAITAKLPIGELDEGDGVVGNAARALHDELLDSLEIDAHALNDRVEASRDLPAMDEWQNFVALRELYVEAAALGGIDLRRLAFADFHVASCAQAARLWNVRKECVIGNAIFRFLLSEAKSVDDAEAVALQERNVACGF